MSQHYEFQSLSAIDHNAATGDARAVLDKAKGQLGFIPNMYARMANSPALLEIYLDGYARLRSSAKLDAIEQEVVFLTISQENGCKYCVAAHSAMADMQKNLPVAVTEAIRSGQPVAHEKLAALSDFAREMVLSRGNPSAARVDAFLAAGYDEHAMLDIILAIAVKTLSNYTNHLFNTPVDAMFAHRRVSD